MAPQSAARPQPRVHAVSKCWAPGATAPPFLARAAETLHNLYKPPRLLRALWTSALTTAGLACYNW
jgi:hypothetical protein